LCGHSFLHVVEKMITAFDRAFDNTLGYEGVMSTDRDDPGNYTPDGTFKGTKFGISARAYPNIDIENLTLEKAKQIYRLDYWEKPGFDKLPESVAIQVFDGAVNSGVRASIMWLQRAVQTTADGIIGPVTVARSYAVAPDTIIRRYLGYRLSHMTDLSIWPSQGRGWARRIARNLVGE